MEVLDVNEKIRTLLEGKYVKYKEDVVEIISQLLEKQPEESINGKWEIRKIYLSGSRMAVAQYHANIIKWVVAQLLNRPFKLRFEGRHDLILVSLKQQDEKAAEQKAIQLLKQAVQLVGKEKAIQLLNQL